MAASTQVLPSVTVQGIPSGAAFAATGFSDIVAFVGPSSRGTLNAPQTIGAQNIGLLTSTFGTGDAIKRVARTMNLVAQQVVFVRCATASVAASFHDLTLGSATLTGAIAGTPTWGADVLITISTAGTTGTGFSYTLSVNGGATTGAPVVVTTALTIVVLGVTLTLTTGKVATLGDTITWWQQPASGSVGPVTTTRSTVPGTSTSAITVTGSPNAAYEGRIEFRSLSGLEATVGTALPGFQYRYSLDAGGSNTIPVFTPWTELGASVSIPLLDGPSSTEPAGITVALGTGTLDPGDFATFFTSPLAYDSAGITSALNALATWSGQWTWVRCMGPVPVALAGVVSTIIAGWETGAPGPKWGIVDARDRVAGESVAAWKPRIVTEWTPFVSIWCGWSAGMARADDGDINGRNNRMPAADVIYVPRFMALPLPIDPGEFDLGPASADVSITDGNQQVVEYDANADPSVYAIGALTLRQWPGIVGIYATGAVLPGPATDIQRIPLRRVQNVAEVLTRQGQLSSILKPLRIIPTGAKPQSLAGYPQLVPGRDLENADVAKINRVIGDLLQRGLVQTGYAPAVSYQVNATPVQLGGGAVKLTGKAQINGFVYPVVFDATVQFVS